MACNIRSFVYFPIIFFILVPVGFFICYGIAVSLSHVRPLPSWPYVSSTGVYPPESCIFTFLLTWGTFAFLTVVLSHYKYVISLGHASRGNKAALIIGIIVCFGNILVASFQATTGGVLIVHLIGASIGFGGAVIYSWVLLYVCWKYLREDLVENDLLYFRLVIAIVEFISAIIFLVATILSLRNKSKYKNFSTITEWILIYSSIIFVATLIYEMNQVRSAQTQLDVERPIQSKTEPNHNSLLLRKSEEK